MSLIKLREWQILPRVPYAASLLVLWPEIMDGGAQARYYIAERHAAQMKRMAGLVGRDGLLEVVRDTEE